TSWVRRASSPSSRSGPFAGRPPGSRVEVDCLFNASLRSFSRAGLPRPLGSQVFGLIVLSASGTCRSFWDLTARRLNGYSNRNENDDIGGPAGQVCGFPFPERAWLHLSLNP